ncbi:hypothetical protein ACQBAR_17580 [Propionibacteriaceae bacterium Y1685]
MTSRRNAPVAARGWRRVAQVLAFIVTQVLIEPVQDGRLRSDGWSRGLRAVVGLSMITYVVLTALTFGSQWLRTNLDLSFRPPDETLPTVLFPLLMAGMIMALTCAWTALIHLRWWVKVPGMVLLSVLLLQWSLTSGKLLELIIHAVLILLLIMVMVIRSKREFHWLEFAFGLMVIGHMLLWDLAVSTIGQVQISLDIRLNSLVQLFQPLWALAAPLGLLAGAAMAELTVSTVTWTVSGVWQGLQVVRRRALVGRIILITIVVLAGIKQVWVITKASDANLLIMTLAGMAEFVLVVALCIPLLVRAQRQSVIRPDADDLIDAWSPVAVPTSVLLAVPFLILLVILVLGAVGLGGVGGVIDGIGGEHQSNVLLGLAGIGLLVASWRIAARGQAARAVLLGGIGATVLVSVLGGLIGVDATVDGFRTGGYVLAVGVLVVLLVRRRLTTERGLAIALSLVLTAVFDYRYWIYEPITAVFTVAGVGASLMVGLIWRLLTDNGFARGDSDRFPRASRVLLAMANSLFAVTAISIVALFGGNWVLDMEVFEDTGDHMIGNGLWAAVTVASFSLAWQGQVIRSERPASTVGEQPTPDSVVQPRWLD